LQLPGPPLPRSVAAPLGPGRDRTDEDPDEDFTVQEIQLEREVEQALSELEAADAAVVALSLQLENATDDVRGTRRELAQLRTVVADWERAAEEGRQELCERQRRVDELWGTLPDESQEVANAVDRVAPDKRRLELSIKRIQILQGQTARLEEQLTTQQAATQSSMNERRRLEHQAEVLELEVNGLRAKQRESRADIRTKEAQLKQRETAIANHAKHRQTLERQLVHLRSDANGLRARLATASMARAAPQATAPRPASTKLASEDAPKLHGAEAGTGPASGEANAMPIPEEARAESLKLQHKVVALWAELKHADIEIHSLEESLRLRDPLAVAAAAPGV